MKKLLPWGIFALSLILTIFSGRYMILSLQNNYFNYDDPRDIHINATFDEMKAEIKKIEIDENEKLLIKLISNVDGDGLNFSLIDNTGNVIFNKDRNRHCFIFNKELPAGEYTLKLNPNKNSGSIKLSTKFISTK